MTEVPISELRPVCDPEKFSFETTADLEPYIGLIGQDRAIEAIKFGLSIESRGFNICVSGEPGTGRTTAIREYLETFARGKPPSNEFCYVNNFNEPHEPRAIELPPGKGRAFAYAMELMISEAQQRIPQTFSSDDFVNRRDAIVASVQRHREDVFNQLAERARTAGFLLQGNPEGYFLIPLAGDQPIDDQAFTALPAERREAILGQRDSLMGELRAATKEAQGVETAATESLAELQHTIATTVVESLLDKLLTDNETFPVVTQYLGEVRRSMIDHIDDFRPAPEPAGPMVFAGARAGVDPMRKYAVNLLVDCSEDECASVVYESNPTPQALFGRIEKEAFFGAVSTDFTMIRPGSIHRANGGYLVLDFDDMIQYPLSWNELKRTIKTGMLAIEELGERLGTIEAKTVRAQPIPWTGKIIAVARESIYRAFYALDPDFRELFKVKADFDMHIDRTDEHEQAYAGLIAAMTQREELLPLDKGAVARIVDEGIRLAEDHNKLSVRFGELTDIVREAAHWAQESGASAVGQEHVVRTVRERLQRVNLIEAHVRESVDKGIIRVDTQGEARGQVNGLSVVDLGDTAFGQPSRITATIGVGREGVIDLQRQAKMSGPIHSKAVSTLQGFLVDRYAASSPLTLTARLSFEQSYGMVEGDSATCAETCALLSRLASAPLRQSLAITGSMDQRGEVQAIGGVNQKIEGFYDVCRIKGLTGEQGVIIPASNVQDLMLREDVVQAVRDHRFAIHAVSEIDQALELLSGVAAGSPTSEGVYPPGSLNGRVVVRLAEIAKDLRDAGGRQGDSEAAAEYGEEMPR